MDANKNLIDDQPDHNTLELIVESHVRVLHLLNERAHPSTRPLLGQLTPSITKIPRPNGDPMGLMLVNYDENRPIAFDKYLFTHLGSIAETFYQLTGLQYVMLLGEPNHLVANREENNVWRFSLV